MELSSFLHNWLLSGADPQVGLRLFMDYCEPNKAIARIVSKDPLRHLQVIKLALFKRANIPYHTVIALSPSVTSTVSTFVISTEAERSKKLRNQWPFLADPECPPELKLLISDKITAYRNCVQEYNKLSDASNAADQHAAARALVTNFIENHNIFKELQHYKESKKVLGEHRIFAQYQRLREFRNSSTMELIKKKKNLEHAIWRNESNIKKDVRPELFHKRTEKIKELKMQLAEVDRLLS